MEDSGGSAHSLQQQQASVAVNFQILQLTALLVALLNSKHMNLIFFY
jgi:hypothetical protein